MANFKLYNIFDVDIIECGFTDMCDSAGDSSATCVDSPDGTYTCTCTNGFLPIPADPIEGVDTVCTGNYHILAATLFCLGGVIHASISNS